MNIRNKINTVTVLAKVSVTMFNTYRVIKMATYSNILLNIYTNLET